MLSFLNRQEKWNTTEDGKRVAEEIKKFGHMETLELQGNTLGVDASVPIAKALEGHLELKRALWSDMFTGRLKSEIPIILKNLCDSMYRSGILLTELDLSDNAIGPMAMPGIEEFLASEACFDLETLRLHNCGMGVAGVNVANCLIECRRKSLETGKKFSLKTIVIGRNRQEYKGATGLAKAFKELGTLEEIVMFQNGIKADGIVALADSFKYNKNLRIINLSDNIFGERGALAMADAMGGLQNLEIVDFSDCLCRNKGSYEICKRLKESGSKLREINLSGNEISDNTARQIIKICANIKSLEKLNLGTNCYGGQFDDLVEFASEYNFVDLGEEEDDEGTGDEKEVSEDEDANENSDVESENENEEPVSEPIEREASATSLNAETTLQSFLSHPNLETFKKIEEERLKMIDYFDEDMRCTRNPTQVTAFLCALSFVAAEQAHKPKVLASIIGFAEDVIREAYAIKMFPLNPISQIVNNLVGNTGVINVENPVRLNLTGLVILFNELLKKNLMREFSGTLKLIKNSDESNFVDENLMERFAKMTT